jgi:hypothetical protein
LTGALPSEVRGRRRDAGGEKGDLTAADHRSALAAARAALDAYRPKFARKDFTRHQHVAILALKAFLRTSYRGVVAYLATG